MNTTNTPDSVVTGHGLWRPGTTGVIAREVTCPFCNAAPEQPCRENISGTTQNVSVHISRVVLAVTR